jgi:DNA repair exonuclease SbcCD ATPase subunit
MSYNRIIHISDTHIRAGDSKDSRFEEYTSQIDRLLTSLYTYDDEDTLIVVTGDIFHDKSKIGPCGQILANQLFRGLSRFQTVIIRGNHDYRQDQPDEPDLIKPFFDDVLDNIQYIDETGLFDVGDIEIGVVCVDDTLIRGAQSGIIAKLPEFPIPSSKSKFKIALFHGSFGGALLQNGSEVESRANYPLEWIQGYDGILLGDIHVQQVHRAKIQTGTDFTSRENKTVFITSKYTLDPKTSPWSYAGSLIQQNFGESLWGHGFTEWDLENNTITGYHIKNDYGKVIVTMNQDNTPCIKIRVGKKQHLVQLKTAVSYGWFPTKISLRYAQSARGQIQHIESLFEEAGIEVCDTGFVEENNVEDVSTTTISAEIKGKITDDMSTLNSTQTWTSFFLEQTKLPEGEWIKWVEHPHLLTLPTPSPLPQDITSKLLDRNSKFQKLADGYLKQRMTQSPIHKFRIHYIEFAWLLCFGEENWVNFDEYVKKVTLINGNNGSGKSAFLEIIAAAIYGESFPSRHNKSFSASILNQHRPSGETSYTRICISIDNKKYWIYRSFDFQPSSERSLWQRTIRLIDDTSGEILLQNANCVNPWIDENVGKFGHFLLTTIMSQSNDSDFFSLSPKEQKSIIDSLLQLNVCEDFRVLLKESVKNHEYALERTTTYETGLNQTSKVFQQEDDADIDTMQQRQSFLRLETQRLDTILQNTKQKFSAVPERAFQTPITDYEANLRKLTNIIETDLSGDYDELKKQRQNLRDRMAVLKSKRFAKPLLLQQTTTITKSFDVLEQSLNDLKMKRAPLGFTQTRLYDSKAYESWLSRKEAWTNVNPDVVASMMPFKTLQKQYKEKIDELNTYEIDEADFPRLSSKVIAGLEKQYNLLAKDISELDYQQKSLNTQLKQIQNVLNVDIRTRNANFREMTNEIVKAFQIEDTTVIKERMETATAIQNTIDIMIRDIGTISEDLKIDEKITYNPTCTDCKENPHRQRKETLIQKRISLQTKLEKQQKTLQSTLQTQIDYVTLKTLYERWTKSQSKTNLQLEEQEHTVQEQLESIVDKITSKTNEMENLEYENIQLSNTYYLLKDETKALETQMQASKYEEETQEWDNLRKISDLDRQILVLEQEAQIAHSAEMTLSEQELRSIETQLSIHDDKQNAQIQYDEIKAIVAVYPFYNTHNTAEKQYRPLQQELISLTVRLEQILSVREKLSTTQSESQRISTYRENLETRLSLITIMSHAFEQYTDWLYPTKVGPAIEDAVNKVLSSIALPRPITLKAVWEQGQFGWYLEDGISRPPYEKCSGAQRFFAGLALRIAFSRMGTSNMINSQVFLDEGFTACDAETMERVPALLKNLLRDLDYMQTIYLVSHLDSLKTVASCSISIIRGAHASRLAIGEKLAPPKGLTKAQIAEDGTVIKTKRGRPKKDIVQEQSLT